MYVVSIADIFIVMIIALMAIRCALRGFVSEFLSMAAFVLGTLSAILFFRQAAQVVREQLMPEIKMLAEIISFILIFLVVCIVVKLLKKLLQDIIAKIRLCGIDRFLGFFYGIAEGVVVVYLLLFLITIQPFIDSDLILGNSILAEKLIELVTRNIPDVAETVAWQNISLTGLFTVV